MSQVPGSDQWKLSITHHGNHDDRKPLRTITAGHYPSADAAQADAIKRDQQLWDAVDPTASVVSSDAAGSNQLTWQPRFDGANTARSESLDHRVQYTVHARPDGTHSLGLSGARRDWGSLGTYDSFEEATAAAGARDEQIAAALRAY